MNTIKTIIFLSLVASAAAYAAEANNHTTSTKQTAIDDSDNRGMSLLFDEKAKPGTLTVSGVSTFAAQAGVQPGDVLKEVCSQPANNLRAYSALTSAIGKDDVRLIVGRHSGKGNVPLAAVKIDNNKLVLSKPVQIQEHLSATQPDRMATIPAGEEIHMVCLPVHLVSDVMAVVAPFETRLTGAGQMLAGGWVPMQYEFERYGSGLAVFVSQLTSWNLPKQIMVLAK